MKNPQNPLKTMQQLQSDSSLVDYALLQGKNSPTVFEQLQRNNQPIGPVNYQLPITQQSPTVLEQVKRDVAAKPDPLPYLPNVYDQLNRNVSRKSEYQISLRRSVIASVLASLALTAGANMFGKDAQPVRVLSHTATTFLDGNGFPLRPAVGAINTPSKSIGMPAVKTETRTANVLVNEQDLTGMKWPIEFSKSPEARQMRNRKGMKSVEVAIRGLTEQGYKINKVTSQGLASMEDRSPDNAGLDRPSVENKMLAYTRERALHNGFVSIVHRVAPDAKVAVLEGREVYNKKLSEQIKDYARVHDLDVTQLVKTYNRNPEQLPKSARKVLDNLWQDRGVKFVITAEKNTNPGKELLYLMPLLLPGFVRKRKDVTEKVEIIPSGAQKAKTKTIPQKTPYVPKVREGIDRVAPSIRRKQPRPYNTNGYGSTQSGRPSKRAGRTKGGNSGRFS